MIIQYDEGKNQIKIAILDRATIFENLIASVVMDIPGVKHSQQEKRFWALGGLRQDGM